MDFRERIKWLQDQLAGMSLTDPRRRRLENELWELLEAIPA